MLLAYSPHTRHGDNRTRNHIPPVPVQYDRKYTGCSACSEIINLRARKLNSFFQFYNLQSGFFPSSLCCIAEHLRVFMTSFFKAERRLPPKPVLAFGETGKRSDVCVNRTKGKRRWEWGWGVGGKGFADEKLKSARKELDSLFSVADNNALLLLCVSKSWRYRQCELVGVSTLHTQTIFFFGGGGWEWKGGGEGGGGISRTREFIVLPGPNPTCASYRMLRKRPHFFPSPFTPPPLPLPPPHPPHPHPFEFTKSVTVVIREDSFRAQELCESWGGRPWLPSLISLRFLWT